MERAGAAAVDLAAYPVVAAPLWALSATEIYGRFRASTVVERQG